MRATKESNNSTNRKRQEKAIRIMSFKWRNDPTNPLFKKLKIMKLKDILLYNNCIFAHDQINENLPENFKRLLSNSRKPT